MVPLDCLERNFTEELSRSGWTVGALVMDSLDMLTDLERPNLKVGGPS